MNKHCVIINTNNGEIQEYIYLHSDDEYHYYKLLGRGRKRTRSIKINDKYRKMHIEN